LKCSTILLQAPLMFRALLRKNPVLLMSDSICFRSASAQSLADLYFLKSFCVTALTLSSVHCAESIVAISSSSGFANLSAMAPY